jgi:hypothetical protein
MKNEPLVTRATVTSAVTAILALLVAFGVDLSNEQRAAVLGIAAVVAPLVVAAITRHRVTPAE